MADSSLATVLRTDSPGAGISTDGRTTGRLLRRPRRNRYAAGSSSGTDPVEPSPGEQRPPLWVIVAQCWPSTHCQPNSHLTFTGPLPASMPTFTPAGSSPSGLSLLETVASEAHHGSRTPNWLAPATSDPAHTGTPSPGPAAVLPPKGEMSEISLDDLPAHVPGQPPLPARPPV